VVKGVLLKPAEGGGITNLLGITFNPGGTELLSMGKRKGGVENGYRADERRQREGGHA